MSKKPASLGMGIIATKGGATPVNLLTPAEKILLPIKNDNVVSEDRTAVTVRLDNDRYRKMKIYGLDTKTSNQDIIVAALDEFLR